MEKNDAWHGKKNKGSVHVRAKNTGRSMERVHDVVSGLHSVLSSCMAWCYGARTVVESFQAHDRNRCRHCCSVSPGDIHIALAAKVKQSN